jgi:hypothetical protein
MKNLGREQQEQFAKKMMLNAQRGQMMNQMNQHHQGGMFQNGYNYFQPQPMMMAPGYSPYAPPMASYMGFPQYNPMASFGFAGTGYAQPMMAPMIPARPAPPPQQVQMPVARPVQQGFNNYPPSNNSMSGFAQPNQMGFNNGSPINVSLFGQNPNPQQNQNPFNGPAYNPFGNGNNMNSGFGPQQGRGW